jgi:signal transduction histidine kinase
VQEGRISKLKISLIASLAVIVTGIIGFVILRQRTKIKLQQQEIFAIRQQAEAADEERNRLSRQLHDLTGQINKKMVSKIKLMTSADESIQTELASEWTKLSSTIHSLSYRLNQNMVADIPLADSIRNLVNEFNHIGDLNIRFDVRHGTVFPIKHKYHLSYIIQELLNNALKHGGACNVELQMTCEAKNHYLFYNDNGPGFDIKTNSPISMGITNIFERAKLMDGIATLITSPGNGTRWIVAVPFNDQDKHEQVG